MVWGAIGYNMWSRLLRIEGNLNSNRYFREVLSLLQETPHATFQQDNARPHVERIVQAFFQRRRRISLLHWPARLPDMSPIEYVFQGPPAPTPDAFWTHIQTAWRDIPHEDIQGLFDSMPRCIDSDCSTWRLHTILKSHAQRPCTVV